MESRTEIMEGLLDDVNDMVSTIVEESIYFCLEERGLVDGSFDERELEFINKVMDMFYSQAKIEIDG